MLKETYTPVNLVARGKEKRRKKRVEREDGGEKRSFTERKQFKGLYLCPPLEWEENEERGNASIPPFVALGRNGPRHGSS